VWSGKDLEGQSTAACAVRHGRCLLRRHGEAGRTVLQRGEVEVGEGDMGSVA
jgi:hypothetical protein